MRAAMLPSTVENRQAEIMDAHCQQGWLYTGEPRPPLDGVEHPFGAAGYLKRWMTEIRSGDVRSPDYLSGISD